jgi:NitT/TauT family transport system substrate-binding protein
MRFGPSWAFNFHITKKEETVNKKTFTSILFSAILLLSLLLGACAQASSTTNPSANDEMPTLKIAVLPILDALPMYVANDQGLFAKQGVKVELIPAASAAERDQLIAAGQADGMINEIVSTILYNKDQIQVQIVRFARVASADSAMYRILAAKDSNINAVNDLKGVPIGISQGTTIEYTTERLLTEAGFQPGDIKTIAVPKISDRMALLGSGELKSATLPEPLSSLAVQGGARVILDDRQTTKYSYSTYAFRKSVIDAQPQAISAFLAAVEEAVKIINQDPQKWSNLLSEQKVVPEPLKGSFVVPKFVTASIPSQAQWDDVLAWEKGKGLVNNDVLYADSVTDRFLPK